MKQMIVFISSIVLGVFIYGLVAGAEDGSIMSTLAGLWEKGLLARSMYGC